MTLKDSSDKNFYDDQGNPEDEVWMSWAGTPQFSSYLKVTTNQIKKHFSNGPLTSLELGAGTCTLSLGLSHLPALSRMICMDISAERMRSLSPKVAKAIDNAEKNKLEYIEGSFNERLPFEDHSVDVILFDAALHHASSPWELLGECRRILRPNGLLIAQREQYLGIMTFNYILKRLLKSEEVLAGVVENAYLRAQYDYFLRARGFEPQFLGVSESMMQKAFGFLNGILFSKWVIVAKPI